MSEDRSGHIAWAKQRALELIDGGDEVGALASIMSDMTKHEETHLSLTQIRDAQEIVVSRAGTLRQWIEDLK